MGFQIPPNTNQSRILGFSGILHPKKQTQICHIKWQPRLRTSLGHSPSWHPQVLELLGWVMNEIEIKQFRDSCRGMWDPPSKNGFYHHTSCQTHNPWHSLPFVPALPAPAAPFVSFTHWDFGSRSCRFHFNTNNSFGDDHPDHSHCIQNTPEVPKGVNLSFFPTNSSTCGILSAPFHDMPKLGMVFTPALPPRHKNSAKHLQWDLLDVNLLLLSLGMMDSPRISLLSSFSLLPLFNSESCKQTVERWESSEL